MLSIVIPTLNEEKFLPRLLRSIKDQDFSDYEIIVSDGGSSDHTAEIAAENSALFVVDRDHHSPSWQRNNGAAAAKGDLLLFLDADSVLQPGFLGKAVKEFEDRELVGAGFYFNFNPNRWSYRIFAFFYNIFCFFRQYLSPASVGAGIMSRKETHDAITGFDTDIILAEDYDYCRRLAGQGRFRMIKSIRLLYSARRLEKDGWLKTARNWMWMASFTVLGRRIKGNKIRYDFGKF
jgi:glycosyltransferase involved in cell wall biosynthesis